MGRTGSFLGQFISYFSGRGFFLVSKTLAIMLLARALEPGDFGLYTLLIFTITLVSTFGTVGMNKSVIYYYSQGLVTRELMGLSLIQAAGGGCFLLLITFVMLTYLPRLFGSLPLIIRLITVSNIPFLILGNIIDGMYTGEKKFFSLTMRNGVRWLLNLGVLSTLFWLYELDLVAALATSLFTNILGVLLFLRPLVRRYPATLVKDLRSLKACYQHSLQLFLYDLSFLACLRLDYYFVKYFESNINLGYYAIATNINEIVLQLPRSFYNIIYSRVADSKLAASELITRLGRFTFILLCLGFLGIAFLGPLIIKIVGGTKFSPAYRVMLVQYPFIIFITLYLILAGYISGIKRLDLLVKANFYTLPLLGLSNLLLIPMWGIYGAALSRSLIGIILFGLVFWPLTKLTRWSAADFFIIKYEDILCLRAKVISLYKITTSA